MSLLAYLVPQKLDKEPAATQALAYILRSKKEVGAEFIHRLGLDLGFEFGRVESERRVEGGQPDLTIFDSECRRRIFIENKFRAGLTDAQPVQYLGALPDDLPSALVFIVPEQRIPTVWKELKTRSGRAYKIEGESTAVSVTRLQMGTRTMCVTSWRHVLELLKQISPNDDVKCDVLQLAGLAKFGQPDEFPPLRGEELSNVSIPSRMINYCGLVDQIILELDSRGVVRTKNSRLTHEWNDIGRSFNWLGMFDLWLGVALAPWKNTSITPLWIREYPGKNSNLGEYYHRLEVFFEDVQKGRDGLDYSRKYIPIRLPTGVERDVVIRDAANQVQRIAEQFGEITGAAERGTEPA